MRKEGLFAEFILFLLFVLIRSYLRYALVSTFMILIVVVHYALHPCSQPSTLAYHRPLRASGTYTDMV